MADDIIKQIREGSPFPWTRIAHPNGLIQILDAHGREVPLFSMTDFVVLITEVMARQKEAA